MEIAQCLMSDDHCIILTFVKFLFNVGQGIPRFFPILAEVLILLSFLSAHCRGAILDVRAIKKEKWRLNLFAILGKLSQWFAVVLLVVAPEVPA